MVKCLTVSMLVFVAFSVTVQWAKIIDNLSNVVTLTGKLDQIFADPLNQSMEHISEHQDGDVFYVISKSVYRDMTVLRDSVNSGDSLKQLNQKLQRAGSSNIYEILLTVPKSLIYAPNYCNRKYIRVCSYTYDVYVGIGSHYGWGWDQNQLKAQTRDLQKNMTVVVLLAHVLQIKLK
ncbi:unnamed protein product [Cunninghamella echinulata]